MRWSSGKILFLGMRSVGLSGGEEKDVFWRMCVAVFLVLRFGVVGEGY